MKIEIDIPKEFEKDYNDDKFDEFFGRVLCDIADGTMCGRYEKETAQMLITSFAESNIAYDVEKKVKELEKTMRTALNKVVIPFPFPVFLTRKNLQEIVNICFEEAIEIVKRKE